MTSLRSRRILHIANFGYKAKGVYLHAMAAKFSNGWTRAGHNVIPFSDRDIARWAGFFGHRKWGVGPANRILLEVARNTAPEIIALGHADVIAPETVAELRRMLPGVKVLQWNIDPIFKEDEASSHDNIRRVLSKIDVVDATFVTTPGAPLAPFALPGKIAAFIPNAVDPSIERYRIFANASPGHDIFFAAGSGRFTRFHCGQHRLVDDLASDLVNARPEVRYYWAGVLGAPLVFGPGYDEALNDCWGGLNISRRNDYYLYSSERIAHYAGNGLVTFIDRANGYQDLFDEDSLAFYSTEDELYEQIARLKRDEAARRAMAEKGWRRYHELFDAAILGQYMIDVVEGTHNPARYPWPTVYTG
ncbi:MAG: glycosyltransferase family 1 protein [Alphaproteobacteria bacterium]|nr:glycosyltransferase family 1 protein [Alphaproteobacteria bacterium]